VTVDVSGGMYAESLNLWVKQGGLLSIGLLAGGSLGTWFFVVLLLYQYVCSFSIFWFVE